MSDEPEDLTIKQDKPIAALLTCKTVAEAAELAPSARLDRRLAQTCGFFCLFRLQKGDHYGGWGTLVPGSTQNQSFIAPWTLDKVAYSEGGTAKTSTTLDEREKITKQTQCRATCWESVGYGRLPLRARSARQNATDCSIELQGDLCPEEQGL